MAKKKNIELQLLRVRHGLNQEDAAAACGFSRSQWGAVENGDQHGSRRFWKAVQDRFHISDADMWKIMNGGA